jgi:acyl-coenzyme A thioesterase PaaI-like protein
MTTSVTNIAERALRAIALNRQPGLHFFGYFLGLAGDRPASGKSTLRLAAPPAIGSSASSAVALATLIDLTLGASIRSWYQPGARLATVTLSIHHPFGLVEGPVEARATSSLTADDHGVAQAQVLEAGGKVVAEAEGWFAVLPAPPGRDLGLLPWEEDVPRDPAPLTLEELTEVEAGVLNAALAAAERAERLRTRVAQELLAFRWEARPEGEAHGVLSLGPELGNRVGVMQGGAVYGAAALAAEKALEGSGFVLADGHYQFLRPADGPELTARAQVTRRGRAVAFVDVTLSVGETLVGRGLFGFRSV